MRLAAIVFLFSTTAVHAQTIYLNYGQWLQMPTSFRQMYIAGAFDALSVLATPQQAPVARYFNECVAKAGLTTAELAQNVKEYGEAQPDMQGKPTPHVLGRYLISLCGLPGGGPEG